MLSLEDKFAAVLDAKQLAVSPFDASGASPVNPPKTTANRSYYFEENVDIQSHWISSNPDRILGLIGAYSYMNSGGYLRDYVLIGRYCSIGRRVSIGAGQHKITGLSTSPHIKEIASRARLKTETNIGTQFARPRATILENDVWVGDGAIVMPGLRLGCGCVVGANAVVTRDVAPYSIVAGSPAREIRKRFSDEISRQLIETRWWNYSKESLDRMPTSNVFDFLAYIHREKPRNAAYPTYLNIPSLP